MKKKQNRRRAKVLVSVVGVVAFVAVGSVVRAIIPTTPADFFFGGTQPGTLTQELMDTSQCQVCHGGFDPVKEPFTPWAASLMGQSARDPVFHAAMAISNQEAEGVGELCLRCHAPLGWTGGRATPADGSGLTDSDLTGVNCSACHRLVDPVYRPGQSPAVDAGILSGLTHPPVNPGNANSVYDPLDRRRGPFALNAFAPHAWLQASYFRTSEMCATCHDISNPVWDKQGDGTYLLDPLGSPHRTGNKYDMFPEQRTYSEWRMSSFAQGAIDMQGRFGGNQHAVSTCQDCHMPKTEGIAANPIFSPIFRTDLPQHFFNGANTWVLGAIRNLEDDSVTNLTEQSVADAMARTQDLLQAASDLQLSVEDVGGQPNLKARVINQTGHKLPTGYPEGRRMWVNVKFFKPNGELLSERGAYDEVTATLSTTDTKVYEAVVGLDAAGAAATGLPPGPKFSLVTINTTLKDNRIPPRGFTNANYASIQASPAGAVYADGQFWDDTLYEVPVGAARAEVGVYYQTSTKEYMEHLRDANTTNNRGLIAYQQWELLGKSAPALMDLGRIELPHCVADYDDGSGTGTPDGGVTIDDLLYYLVLFEAGTGGADVDDGSGTGTRDGGVTIDDLLYFLARFEAGC